MVGTDWGPEIAGAVREALRRNAAGMADPAAFADRIAAELRTLLASPQLSVAGEADRRALCRQVLQEIERAAAEFRAGPGPGRPAH